MWVAGASGFEVSGLVLEHQARRCFRGRDLDLFPTVFAMFAVVTLSRPHGRSSLFRPEPKRKVSRTIQKLWEETRTREQTIAI